MSGSAAGTNETSVFSVDPRAADDFLLPDTTDAGADAAPYDVRGSDEITVLVDNGTDQSVDVQIETFAFNTPNADGTVDDADTTYGPVTNKEGVDTTSIAAGEAEPVSFGIGALAYVQIRATFGNAPTSGSLTIKYQSDRQG